MRSEFFFRLFLSLILLSGVGTTYCCDKKSVVILTSGPPALHPLEIEVDATTANAAGTDGLIYLDHSECCLTSEIAR
jgi:hypothetical protein